MKLNNWRIKKESNIVIQKAKDKITVINETDEEAKIYATQNIKCKDEYINAKFSGKIIKGSGATLELINRHNVCRLDTIINSQASSCEIMKGHLFPIIVINPHTTIELENVEIYTSTKQENAHNNFLGKKKILLITPSYSELENLNANDSIHTLIKEYIKQGLDIEVACIDDYNSISCYEIDGVNIYKSPFIQLRPILMARKYDAILVNATSSKYKHFLETSYIKDTPIINLTDEANRNISFIKEQIKEPQDIIAPITEIADEPILTITIPAYNSEKFLEKCLLSMLKTKYAYLTEILVINDGSKDATPEIGKKYQDLTTVDGKSIVKIINKENGGHGSGINKGIELARGKYFKVVDADDWLEEEEYEKLLERLINEDVDLVLTDLCEARSFQDKPEKLEYYKNLKPDVVYNFDDICIGENGFERWGPMLPTSTCKTECLRKANFKLLEKTFYVDMTYNAYSIININTVKKYDLNIYRYYIGNIGQSVSEEGMKRNYKSHENVTIELMRIVSEEKRLSDNKREYVLRRLCLPMVYVQYYIELDLLRSREKFLVFEQRVKQFKDLMQYDEFNKRVIKFHRYTKGIFIKIMPFLRRILGIVRRILPKKRINLNAKLSKEADVLVVTPNYPSQQNLYYCAFVHSRVKEYVKNGLKVQVAAISGGNFDSSVYIHDGIPVIRGNLEVLKELLSRKQYKVIVTHFVDENLYPIYKDYITNEKLIFICHGPETVFRYLLNVTRPYFTKPIPYPYNDPYMNIKEKWVKIFSQKDNVEWVFVSQWLKEFSEKELRTKFKHVRIINNIINEELFPYKEKKEEDRLKIIVIRKFDNIIQHSLDQVVLTILELSRRPFFYDLDFEIYGDGNFYDELIEPIRRFKNVHLHREFIPNNQIHKVYEKAGILLIPSRHDAHAVAMGEGAASGLVVVGSNVTSNPFFMNEKENHTLADPEDYVALADIIERLYNNPKEFLEISKRLSKETRENYCKSKTVLKEVELIKEKLESYTPGKERLTVKLNIMTKGRFMQFKYYVKRQGKRVVGVLRKLLGR